MDDDYESQEDGEAEDEDDNVLPDEEENESPPSAAQAPAPPFPPTGVGFVVLQAQEVAACLLNSASVLDAKHPKLDEPVAPLADLANENVLNVIVENGGRNRDESLERILKTKKPILMGVLAEDTNVTAKFLRFNGTTFTEFSFFSPLAIFRMTIEMVEASQLRSRIAEIQKICNENHSNSSNGNENLLNDCALHVQNRVQQIVSEFSGPTLLGIEDLDAYLEHLKEELKKVEVETTNVANEIELLATTHKDDSILLKAKLEEMECSLDYIATNDHKKTAEATEGIDSPMLVSYISHDWPNISED
ncbi:hypothetical protein SESBI_42164 [Sesbania bispinosa]|nr:hypothetical protein SESBI_42164 [Sesbania bispinosa]